MQTIGDTKMLFDLAQKQQPTIGDNSPPSNLATTDLPETDDSPGKIGVRSIMADVVSQKMA